MSTCEWNPSEDRPSYTTEPGCTSRAAYIIKFDGDEMHVCEVCAKLPPFKGKKRRIMSKSESTRECVTHHAACIRELCRQVGK